MGIEVIYNSEGAIIDTVVTQDVPAVRYWDAYDFKLRLTYLERIAIRVAAKTDVIVEDFLDMLNTAAATGTRIMSDDAMVISGLGYMEATGVIGEGRAEALVT